MEIRLEDLMLDYRAKHNISQKKLAKLCELSEQTICNIENGHQHPSKLTKAKILRAISN